MILEVLVWFHLEVLFQFPELLPTVLLVTETQGIGGQKMQVLPSSLLLTSGVTEGMFYEFRITSPIYFF